MAEIVGVHGIANEQLGRHQLRTSWTDAAGDGVERAWGRPVAAPDLDVAFFGDILAGAEGPGKLARAAFDAQELSTDDARIVVEAAAEVLPPAELSAPAPEKGGFPPIPESVRRVVAALDRRFGAHAGWLFTGELSQVRRYLTDPVVKQAVDDRVAEAVGGVCRVLVGHSLGSVVAFEHLRRSRDHRVDTFVTLGSPLALRAVRHLMPEPGFGSGPAAIPGLRRWVNLFDRRDPVASAGGLSTCWPSVEDDDAIDNGREPHAATRYLGKRQAGAAMLAAVPELTSR